MNTISKCATWLCCFIVLKFVSVIFTLGLIALHLHWLLQYYEYYLFSIKALCVCDPLHICCHLILHMNKPKLLLLQQVFTWTDERNYNMTEWLFIGGHFLFFKRTNCILNADPVDVFI